MNILRTPFVGHAFDASDKSPTHPYFSTVSQTVERYNLRGMARVLTCRDDRSRDEHPEHPVQNDGEEVSEELLLFDREACKNVSFFDHLHSWWFADRSSRVCFRPDAKHNDSQNCFMQETRSARLKREIC